MGKQIHSKTHTGETAHYGKGTQKIDSMFYEAVALSSSFIQEP